MKTTLQKELALELKGDTDIVFTRHFDAPRDMVYDCHTKPELMRQWLLGPDGWSFDICDVDVRVGGKYLYVWAHPQQGSFGMHGVFREVAAPGRLVNTESFIPNVAAHNPNASEDPNAALNTLVLTSEGEGTLMTLVCRYPSAEIRQKVIETGMATGMETSYKRLDKMFAARHG